MKTATLFGYIYSFNLASSKRLFLSVISNVRWIANFNLKPSNFTYDLIRLEVEKALINLFGGEVNNLWTVRDTINGLSCRKNNGKFLAFHQHTVIWWTWSVGIA